MTTDRRLKAFGQGMGVEGTKYCCSECGYESENRKNFKRTEDREAHTCSTGHFTDKNGDIKRQRNPYARR